MQRGRTDCVKLIGCFYNCFQNVSFPHRLLSHAWVSYYFFRDRTYSPRQLHFSNHSARRTCPCRYLSLPQKCLVLYSKYMHGGSLWSWIWANREASKILRYEKWLIPLTCWTINVNLQRLFIIRWVTAWPARVRIYLTGASYVFSVEVG